MSNLKKSDPQLFKVLKKEEKRQQEKLSMIPSENAFSPAVREALGSIVSHKYSEGNVGQRYYAGNEFIDELESLAIERARKLFKLPKNWDVNVQATSGSNANLAVYLAVLNIGDTMMGMYLPDGGHLSHGWSVSVKKQDPNNLVYKGGEKKVNITSKIFTAIQYKTNPKTQLFDYDEVEKIALKYKPKLIITGGTAYPRDINYGRMRKIADKVGALYLADIAHEAGLIAGGALPSPVGIADIVTMTAQKTLRAGRGAVILARRDLIEKINRAILPGLQGNPHNHSIAGMAVGFGEALKPEFTRYAKQVVKNAQVLAKALKEQGFHLVSGGTDKHLILINLTTEPLFGKKFARALDQAGIIVNFNTMPQETRSPADPSAIRLGTPWLTTRGMKPKEMNQITVWIRETMNIAAQWKDLDFEAFNRKVQKSSELAKIAREVKDLCRRFPLAT